MFVFALGQNGHCFCVVEIHACDADTIGQLTCYMHYNNIIILYGIYSMHLLYTTCTYCRKNFDFVQNVIILSIVELFFTCVCVCMKATIIIGN